MNATARNIILIAALAVIAVGSIAWFQSARNYNPCADINTIGTMQPAQPCL